MSLKSIKENLQIVFREHVESFILAFLLALILRAFVLSAYYIPVDSMAPQLTPGDFVLAYKLPFGVKLPLGEWAQLQGRPAQRGEVVLLDCPEPLGAVCIRRVVGLPGDRIELINKQLWVNEHKVKYRALNGSEDFGPFIVPPGEVFVLADNRQTAQDSRHWGGVPVDHIHAQILGIWLSFDWGRPEAPRSLPKVRWERLFKSVH